MSKKDYQDHARILAEANGAVVEMCKEISIEKGISQQTLDSIAKLHDLIDRCESLIQEIIPDVNPFEG